MKCDAVYFQCTAVALTIVRSFLTSAWRECRKDMYGPPHQVRASALLKSSWPESHRCKQLRGPSTLATKDLRFPIPTPNWIMPFLSSIGWQVTYWFILLRRPLTNLELTSSIFIHFCWVSLHKIFNYILELFFQDEFRYWWNAVNSRMVLASISVDPGCRIKDQSLNQELQLSKLRQ